MFSLDPKLGVSFFFVKRPKYAYFLHIAVNKRHCVSCLKVLCNEHLIAIISFLIYSVTSLEPAHLTSVFQTAGSNKTDKVTQHLFSAQHFLAQLMTIHNPRFDHFAMAF